jgi:hypothetical protein
MGEYTGFGTKHQRSLGFDQLRLLVDVAIQCKE